MKQKRGSLIVEPITAGIAASGVPGLITDIWRRRRRGRDKERWRQGNKENLASCLPISLSPFLLILVENSK
jgi:hypothetical protein